MFIMIIALIALFLVLICVGRYPISPFRAFEIIGRSFVGKTDGMDVYESSVILSIRLPRILMGILVGAGLSVSGAIYQAVFGNPLVSPDILGVSSGAGFGAALAILLSCGMGCHTGDRARLRPSGSGGRSEPVTHQEAQRTVRAGAVGRYCEVHV